MSHSNQAQGPTSNTWWINFGVQSSSIKFEYTLNQVYIDPDGIPPSRSRNRKYNYRQVDHEHMKPFDPKTVGPGKAEMRIAESSVNLVHSGFEEWHILNGPADGYITPNEQFGDKENLKITAIVRSVANCGRNDLHGVSLEDNSLVYEAQYVSDGNTEKLIEYSAQAKEMSAFNYYEYINPILYIQQPNGGFLLFAELRSKNGWGRMLFSAMQHVPQQQKPAEVGKTFPEGQLTVISKPYRASAEFRKLEVKQDGDVFSPAIYLEFRAKNRIRGFFMLANPRFPFMGEEDSHIGIGYWPRRDREALYFHGDIASVECDPHGLCPCSG